jgi:hypothetical protein
MRIAYLTNDEVNRTQADTAAAECGTIICALPSNDFRPDGQFDGVLYDLESVEKDERADLVAQIIGSPSTCPRAVHGYCISDEQAKNLRRRGLAVVKRFRAGLIRILCNAAYRSDATVPPDNELTDLTWVNLVK